LPREFGRPAGAVSSTRESVSFGRRDMPYVPGQRYGANVRLDHPLNMNDLVCAEYTKTHGPPYSMPYPSLYSG